ncbi:MAG: magnesium/cobalt transporter CorA [Deltaproteobacteria bacterium]|nr:magnesium/cobalt transporter CorA [Deltaproteobacteria bacterium]
MRLILKKILSKKAGLPPGTLIHVGEKKLEKAIVKLIDYSEDGFEEKELGSINECLPYKEKDSITWLNIDGLHDIDLINNTGFQFNLHPLILEDILNTEQRPKLDDIEDYLFIVAKMITYKPEEDRMKFEQISFILLKNFLITFQEDTGDVFEPVRERLRKGKGRIRKMGSDYLMYTLLDALVDSYYGVLEKIGDRIENLEDDLMNSPEPETLRFIHNMKRELVFLRRSVWPIREIIGSLERGESNLISEKTSIFYRDVYDHTIQVIDTIETCRDIVSGMMDLFLSSVSNRMNQVMKMLTVIATIFIPLTFIAGIYGMNFEFMPELKWRWGYPAAWIIMAVIGILMIFWFKRKKIL